MTNNMTNNNLTFTKLKDLVVTECHKHPDNIHRNRHGRFTNSAFGKPWNFNRSPKDYDKVSQRHNYSNPTH